MCKCHSWGRKGLLWNTNKGWTKLASRVDLDLWFDEKCWIFPMEKLGGRRGIIGMDLKDYMYYKGLGDRGGLKWKNKGPGKGRRGTRWIIGGWMERKGWENWNEGHTAPQREWRQHSLLNLKGLRNRAFSLNISNITDLPITLTLYLDNFRCCKVLLNIQPQNLPHLSSYPLALILLS